MKIFATRETYGWLQTSRNRDLKTFSLYWVNYKKLSLGEHKILVREISLCRKFNRISGMTMKLTDKDSCRLVIVIFSFSCSGILEAHRESSGFSGQLGGGTPCIARIRRGSFCTKLTVRP